MSHISSILENSFRLQRLLRKGSDKPLDGTTMLQWYVVGIIAHEPGITTTKLAEEMGVALPTASASIDKLVAAGLVERQADDNDRRVSRLSLTPHGRLELDSIKQAKLTKAESVLSLLPKEDQAQLDRIITSLVTALENTKQDRP